MAANLLLCLRFARCLVCELGIGAAGLSWPACCLLPAVSFGFPASPPPRLTATQPAGISHVRETIQTIFGEIYWTKLIFDFCEFFIFLIFLWIFQKNVQLRNGLCYYNKWCMDVIAVSRVLHKRWAKCKQTCPFSEIFLFIVFVVFVYLYLSLYLCLYLYLSFHLSFYLYKYIPLFSSYLILSIYSLTH